MLQVMNTGHDGSLRTAHANLRSEQLPTEVGALAPEEVTFRIGAWNS
jgi:Flp pilus assembly CpaF family ATPase